MRSLKIACQLSFLFWTTLWIGQAQAIEENVGGSLKSFNGSPACFKITPNGSNSPIGGLTNEKFKGVFKIGDTVEVIKKAPCDKKDAYIKIQTPTGDLTINSGEQKKIEKPAKLVEKSVLDQFEMAWQEFKGLLTTSANSVGVFTRSPSQCNDPMWKNVQQFVVQSKNRNGTIHIGLCRDNNGFSGQDEVTIAQFEQCGGEKIIPSDPIKNFTTLKIDDSLKEIVLNEVVLSADKCYRIRLKNDVEISLKVVPSYPRGFIEEGLPPWSLAMTLMNHEKDGNQWALEAYQQVATQPVTNNGNNMTIKQVPNSTDESLWLVRDRIMGIKRKSS